MSIFSETIDVPEGLAIVLLGVAPLCTDWFQSVVAIQDSEVPHLAVVVGCGRTRLLRHLTTNHCNLIFSLSVSGATELAYQNSRDTGHSQQQIFAE